jgi:hypothetical protein
VTQEEAVQLPDPFVEKLRDFYESTLAQHKVSFWASVVASGVGLIAVILALTAYFSNPGNLSESVVLGVAGVLAQFISAAFFYLHNKSTAQVYAGFEKLVKLQDTQLAVSLVSRMSEKNHDYMYMNIINVLILRNEPNRELTPELVRALRESGKA